MLTTLAALVNRQRIRITQLFFLLVLALLLSSRHSWQPDGALDLAIESSGFLLLGFCMLGRIWCSLYISGRKSTELVALGPYSMVRHPLYFFSFWGVVGAGLASENLVLIIILPLAFLAYYPFIMLDEERLMRERFGEAYLEYCRVVPRFWPRLSRLREPEAWSVSPRLFRRHLLDAMWFLWIFAGLQFIEWLHESGTLSTLFSIP